MTSSSSFYTLEIISLIRNIKSQTENNDMRMKLFKAIEQRLNENEIYDIKFNEKILYFVDHRYIDSHNKIEPQPQFFKSLINDILYGKVIYKLHIDSSDELKNHIHVNKEII